MYGVSVFQAEPCDLELVFGLLLHLFLEHCKQQESFEHTADSLG